MKALVIVLFFFGVCVSEIRAQSMYKLSYNLPYNGSEVLVNSFLFQYEDGSGFLRSRLKLPITNEDILLEMELEEEDIFINESTIDNNKKYIKAVNTQILMGNAEVKLATPVFLFEFDKASNTMLPKKLLAEPAIGERQEVGNANFKAINILPINLKKEMLAPYFFDDDDFMQNIFTITPKGTPAIKGVTMHLIIVANTLEPVIGNSCKMDMEKIKTSFTQIAMFGGAKVNTVSIHGKNYSKQNLLAAVKKLKVNTKDIIVFYYTGHGFRNEFSKTKYPYMDLRLKNSQDYLKESLSISTIYDDLKLKGARLTIVLGDCCNTFIGASKSFGAKPVTPKSSLFPMSRTNVDALFFNENKMAILATAADSTEKASSNNNFGGFFTYFLKSSMESNCGIIKTNPTWYRILEDANKETVKKAKRTYCDKPYTKANICNQHPVYNIE